jgi:hypothetical protein
MKRGRQYKMTFYRADLIKKRVSEEVLRADFSLFFLHRQSQYVMDTHSDLHKVSLSECTLG